MTVSWSPATLLERGLDVGVYLLGQAADVKGDARTNLAVLRNVGGDVVEIADAGAWELHGSDVLGSDLIVDALFGTGISGPLTGLAETIVADLNASDRPVVSIDLPSGLSADTAEVPGPAVDATTDRDARGAKTSARAAAGRSAGRQARDRGHRHSVVGDSQAWTARGWSC